MIKFIYINMSTDSELFTIESIFTYTSNDIEIFIIVYFLWFQLNVNIFII